MLYRAAKAATLFLVTMLLAVQSAASGGDNFELSYRVVMDGRKLGRIEVSLGDDGADRQVRAVTLPEGIASLFADEVTERFSFHSNGARWRAIDYSESNGKDDGLLMRFEYGEEMKAVSPGQTSRHDPASLVEPQGFPLATYLLSPEELDDREVLMPSDRGIRTYRYTMTGEERVTIGDRTFETRRWLKQRPDRESRGFIIWSEMATRIPVRVEKFRKKGSMVMELTTPLELATD